MLLSAFSHPAFLGTFGDGQSSSWIRLWNWWEFFLFPSFLFPIMKLVGIFPFLFLSFSDYGTGGLFSFSFPFFFRLWNWWEFFLFLSFLFPIMELVGIFPFFVPRLSSGTGGNLVEQSGGSCSNDCNNWPFQNCAVSFSTLIS